MRDKRNEPVYMIGIAAKLCGIHPQTLRQYERLGFVTPTRIGTKNRLYSEYDIYKVRQVQRLTQDLGVNLAGVEIILRLLDDMEGMRVDLEEELESFKKEAEQRIQMYMTHSKVPIRKDEQLLPTPHLKWKKFDL